MKGNRFASGSARPAATSRCAIGLTIAFLVGCSDDPPAAAPADEVIDTDTVVLDTVATDSSPADTLWDILLDGVNDDASNPGDVPGTNAAPLIELLEPASDAHFAFGSPVVLRAIVTDDADLPGDLAVTWSSPIQGSFYEGSPADDGLFSVTTSELVLGTHALTLRAADSAGAESTADVSITIDPLDGAPTLVIEPAAPTTVHDLTATVTDFVLDGSAAALEVTWSWFNGPDPVDVTGAIVSADLTTKGETWRVQAVVSNGTTTTPAGVAQVTIGNAAPSCPGGAVITLGSSGLTCACNGREEPDPADPALDTCAWTGDGAPVAGDCHFDVAPAALAVPGTVLGCTLTPFDGEDAGEDVVAPTVVVPGGDVNSPPTTPTVALTPPFGQPQHTFTCQVVSPASDADGDPISYVVSWAVNGYWNPAVTSETVVPQSALTTSAGAAAGDGDVLRCRVVASDGKASSPAGESGPVTLGTVGVAIDGLGPVTLDEDLGNGCFKDTGFALPSCEPGFPCTVDVKACFAADGSLVGPATVSTTASLPVFGDVALTGSADTADGSLCVAGATADLLPPAVPLALTGLTLTLCRDPSGLWTSSASGRVAIDGETVAFKDADLTTTTGGASFAIALPSFFIDGTPFAGTITVATGATAVPLDGTVTLAPAGVIPASGAFETTAGAFVSAELTAKNTSNIGGIDFALGARLALDSGAWRFEVKGGALTLPGGQPLAVSGDVAVVAGVLKDGVFEAPAGPVTFAGTPFTGPVALAWSKGAWQLTLPGGTLGNDTAFTLRGALTVVAGAVVGGALSAGQDLTLGGVTFVGPAPVSWTSTSLSIALGGGVVSLPAGGVTLSGQLVLDAGTLTAATFDVTGGVALAGLAFPGPTTATWSGDETWALAVSGASLPLPGGSNAPLSGTLTVTGGRVASGGFTSPAPVSFAGLAFAGPATAAYAVPWDDLGSPGAESLTLELAGGALALSGAQSLTLSGDVVIANGQVQSAAFAATDAVSLDSVPFTGATVAFESGRLWLDLAGGTLNVAGAPVTVSGRLAIDAGALGCGELSPDAAASATVGGVAFGLGVRYAPAGRTCTWPDGTTFTSTTGELLAALSGGKLTVDGKTLTLS
ncbi:MAG: hypothetical protein IV100_10765, partial [Myxococcales bacterium]|nr:hypothetical protein [Myxococcales bacterium]